MDEFTDEQMKYSRSMTGDDQMHIWKSTWNEVCGKSVRMFVIIQGLDCTIVHSYLI